MCALSGLKTLITGNEEERHYHASASPHTHQLKIPILNNLKRRMRVSAITINTLTTPLQNQKTAPLASPPPSDPFTARVQRLLTERRTQSAALARIADFRVSLVTISCFVMLHDGINSRLSWRRRRAFRRHRTPFPDLPCSFT